MYRVLDTKDPVATVDQANVVLVVASSSTIDLLDRQLQADLLWEGLDVLIAHVGSASWPAGL